jgi:hypothetical protein
MPKTRNWSKRAALFVAVMVCTSVLWADSEPWKSKPYEAWDAKDIQTIMTESPWVRKTSIRHSWSTVSQKEKNAALDPLIDGGVRETPNASGATQTNPNATVRSSEESTQQLIVDVNVYWDSSRVMRAASARQRVLHGEIKDSEVEPYAHAPQEEYQLVLSMGDMTPFMQSDEKFYQANSFLEMKRSKLKLSPSHVVYQKDSHGILKQVVFFFPKKTSGGQPTIGSDETDVEFNCKVADSKLRVDFKTSKMADQSGPDL